MRELGQIDEEQGAEVAKLKFKDVASESFMSAVEEDEEQRR